MEGEPAASLQPIEIRAQLDPIGREAAVGEALCGGGEDARGADAVVAGEVGRDGHGGAAIDVIGELVGAIGGVGEELAHAEQGIEGPSRLVHLEKTIVVSNEELGFHLNGSKGTKPWGGESARERKVPSGRV